MLQHNYHPLKVQQLFNPKAFGDKQPNQLCAPKAIHKKTPPKRGLVVKNTCMP